MVRIGAREIAMSHWGFWEWLAYSGLWISAIILAADIGLKISSDLREKFASVIASPIWGFTPLILLTLSGAIFLVRETGLIGDRPRVPAPVATQTPSIPDAPLPKTPSAPVPPKEQKNTSVESKIIVDVTYEYLMSFYKDRMSYQADALFAPYKNKWISLSGSIADIRSFELLSSREVFVVLVNPPSSRIGVYFDYIWNDRLQVLRKGHEVSTLCQIIKADVLSVRLEHCELAD
jgi:hypothetical protein